MNLSLLAASQAEPDRPALMGDEDAISYGVLAQAAGRAASWLNSHGARTGPVAVVANNELPTAILLHALIASGIPVLLLHPRHTNQEHAALARRAGATLLVSLGWHTELGRQPLAALPPPCPDDERPLAIVPTSGTEGAERLVVLSRRAFLASAQASAQNLGWKPDDHWLACLPLAHIGGFSILTRCLQGRRTAVLAAPGDTGQAIKQLGTGPTTLVSLVPAQLVRLLAAWPHGTAPPKLRAVLLGGDAVLPSLLKAAERWPVLTTYGLTEACSQVTCEDYPARPASERGAGRPLPGVELKIVQGRIHVRGPTLCSGYWQQEGSALGPGDWLMTGDLGRLDADGQLHVLGRDSDLIITGGENVLPAEVERVLESIPGIVAACVFGIEDGAWGQLVAAALVSASSELPDDRELRARLQADLCRYKQPRSIAWVPALRYGPTGKLDRRKTRDLVRERLRPLGGRESP